MVVQPYKVTLKLEGISVPGPFKGTEKLALAYDSYNAMHNVLSVFCGIRSKRYRDLLIQGGHVHAENMSAFSIMPKHDDVRHVFAPSPLDARDMEESWNPLVLPCEPWFALNDLSDAELADQCLLVWAYMNGDKVKSDLAWYVFPVWARKRKYGYGSDKWKEDHTLAHRTLMIAQLRLAMLLPFIPSRRVCGRTDDLRKEEFAEQTQRTEAIARFKELHKGNIGIQLVNECLNAVGPELTLEAEDHVERFCLAYGYDAHFMRWAEIQALWNKGMPGLKTKRLDGSLGIR